MDVPDLHRRAVDEFGARVSAVGSDQWTSPTPCEDWDVRALVNHLVGEDRWTSPLMDGRTIEEVGSRFDGDLLGSDPNTAWTDAAREAVAAVSGPGAMDRTAHLSFGDVPGHEYAMQLFTDHLVHTWDLAHAIGADEKLDPGLVDACAAWFDDHEESYRAAGVIGPSAQPAGGSAQDALLARFGRTRRNP